MSVLSVTSRGQVTFRRDVLQHLGLRPGDKIEVELLPGGRVELRAPHPKGSVTDLYAVLSTRTNGAKLSVDQLEAAIAEVGRGRP